MLNTLFFVKLIAMPCFTALVAYIQKRWSHKLGGAISGLPLTAGPISVFLAIEQGLPFAREAAVNAMLGYLATSIFVYVFVFLAKKRSWPICLLAGTAAWGVSAIILALLPLSMIMKMAIGLATLLLNTLFVFGFSHDEVTHITKKVPYDVVIRAVSVLVPLLVITALAPYIGANYSGVLGGIPAMWSVLFSFTLAHSGRLAVVDFFKGATFCAWGFQAFFFTLIFLPITHVLWLYVVASVVASFFGYGGYKLMPKMQRVTRQSFRGVCLIP